MSGLDWQYPIVFALVAGAAFVVLRRVWRLFKAPRQGATACGSCGTCGTGKSEPMTPASPGFVSLESFTRRPTGK
jgi:hypothetical protein